VSHSGTPEQFATLVALVARELGVPARLVAGFRIPTSGTSLPAGSYQVTSADAWTWVEIPIRGLGWVVLDPSPGRYGGPAPPDAGSARSPTPLPSPSQNAQLTHSNSGGHAVAPQSRTPGASGLSATELLAVALIAAVVALALLVCFALARKQVRARRRRRHGDPRRRLLGAWQEAIDVLVEAGLPDLSCATSAEVVASTAARFGTGPGERARRLGAAANVAIFSPTSWIPSDAAEEAWRDEVALSRAVRGQLDRRARLRARLRFNRRQPAGPRPGARRPRPRLRLR
jgi:hypothetical protein